MKTWIIASIILGVLVIGGFAIVSAISNSDNIEDNSLTAQTQASTVASTCTGSCGGGCTQQGNCGAATCGAVSGTGSCGCGKR